MFTTTGEAITLSTVPAFLTKLWSLVDNSSTDDLICWDSSGRSFHVLDQSRFAKEILPLYFKHNNIASFIRQLNMYGFRKVVNTEAVNIKAEKDDMEFAHPYFIRDQEELLELIKRKVPNARSSSAAVSSDEVGSKTDDVRHALSEVSALKGRQDTMTAKLDSLKFENEVLWREVASLRQMHKKQQQVVAKLIQFLLAVVQRPLATAGVKRKAPLMLGAASLPAKVPREQSSSGIADRNYIVHSPLQQSAVNTSVESPGIVIDETSDLADLAGFTLSVPESTAVLTNDLPTVDPEPIATIAIGDNMEPLALPADGYDTGIQLTDVWDAEFDAKLPCSDLLTSDIINEAVPQSTATKTSAMPSTSSAVALADSHKQSSEFNRTDITSHLDLTASHLAGLRDIIASSPQISLDSNAMFELFGMLDSLPLYVDDLDQADEEWQNAIGASTNVEQNKLDGGGVSIAGNELIQYTPAEDVVTSLYDLLDPASLVPLSAAAAAIDNDDDDLDSKILATPMPRITDNQLHECDTNNIMEDVD